MFKYLATVVIAICGISEAIYAEAVPGKAAPSFEVADANGKVHKLSDYTGEWLVLEWFNKDCPYVRKHYSSGNMQKLQKQYGAKNVKWLTVISSAPKKQGYLSPAEARKIAEKEVMASMAILLDSEGKMGKAYGAKVTPHMFVVNPKGMVVYAGAIDDNDSSNPAVIPLSKNYVVEALDAAMSGKPVKTTSSRAYGCTIKYLK